MPDYYLEIDQHIISQEDAAGSVDGALPEAWAWGPVEAQPSTKEGMTPKGVRLNEALELVAGEEETPGTYPPYLVISMTHDDVVVENATEEQIVRLTEDREWIEFSAEIVADKEWVFDYLGRPFWTPTKKKAGLGIAGVAIATGFAGRWLNWW